MNICEEKKTDLEEILFSIFMNYSVFSELYCDNCLKVKKFITLCREAKLINTKLNLPSLDLLFRSLTKNSPNMFFPTFVKSTLKLAELNDPVTYKTQPVNTYILMITNHFLPLLDSVQHKQFEIIDYIEDIPEDCKITFHSKIKGLLSVYLKIFIHEQQVSDDLEKLSKKEMEKLLRDLEMYPGLISINRFEILWRDLNQLKGLELQLREKLIPDGLEDIGKIFTFSKFLMAIYLISVFAYADSKVHISANEKLGFVIDRIELCRNEFFFGNGSLEFSVEGRRDCWEFEGFDEDFESFSLELAGIEVNEHELQSLRRFFEQFSNESNSSSGHQMKSAGFLKALKILGLVQVKNNKKRSLDNSSISPAQADLIFSKLKRNISKSKRNSDSITFPLFLKSLEILSKKLFPSEPAQVSFKLLLENYFFRFLSNESPEFILNNLTTTEIQDIYPVLQKSLTHCFKAYSNPQFQMSSSLFFRFCKDFEIFPDLISKTKLLKLFHITCGQSDISESYFSSSRMSSDQLSKSSGINLNESKFTELLILVSLNAEITKGISEDLQKICFIFERLEQSTGTAKVLNNTNQRPQSLSSFNIRSVLKSRYPSLFNQPVPKKPSFQDLAFLIPLPSPAITPLI